MTDSDGYIHILGKIIDGVNAVGTHDNFSVYECDELFDKGRVKQLSMQYEIYGALVEHHWAWTDHNLDSGLTFLV